MNKQKLTDNLEGENFDTNAIYGVIDLQITLRCNGGCKNCIKLCCSENLTGLNYNNFDMSIDQVKKFIDQVKNLGERSNNYVSGYLFITGGEPTLHPDIIEITKLVVENLSKYVEHNIYVNSNLVKGHPDEIKEYVKNFSTPDVNYLIHNTIYIHPDDSFQERPTYKTCNHYRKGNITLTYHGYSLCCASDGYIRLFGKEDLFVDKLPDNIDGFPVLDDICQHCSFGCNRRFKELEFGRPVSKIYLKEAKKNRKGYRINKKY